MSTLVHIADSQQAISLADLIAGQSGVTEIVCTVPDGITASMFDDVSTLSLVISLVLGKGAQITYRGILVVMSGNVQRDIRVVCRHQEGSATVSLACHTQESGSLVITTLQDHCASQTQSAVRIMGVSENNSRVTVSSTIHIEKNQKAVVARQVHKHLLLDSGARAVSVPALDILSDDVSCSHGSAITHLNQSNLFYLQARGYDEKMARDAVVKAFLAN
jgi:Fe-S cluster assembly scaffold protein SufB